jgi:hypothetical protein
MRRALYIDRTRLMALLDAIPNRAHQACRAELRAGASFRLHDGTVARENVLRAYASWVPAAGSHDALQRLATSPHSHVRLGAVSGGSRRYVLFLDPDGMQIIACLDAPL